jgi:hypothetical protein
MPSRKRGNAVRVSGAHLRRRNFSLFHHERGRIAYLFLFSRNYLDAHAFIGNVLPSRGGVAAGVVLMQITLSTFWRHSTRRSTSVLFAPMLRGYCRGIGLIKGQAMESRLDNAGVDTDRPHGPPGT